jgi:group I intron endonuclease
MSNCGIYRILNTRNGKFYIGSSKNLKSRKSDHFKTLRSDRHHSIKLQRAWNKHQDKSFVFEPILFCNEEMLITYEQQFLNFYKPQYNMSLIAGRMDAITRAKATENAIKFYSSEDGKACCKNRAKKSRKTILDRGLQRGNNNGNSILTEQDVINIAKSEKSSKELAKFYNVSFYAIDDIRSRRSWKHLSLEIKEYDNYKGLIGEKNHKAKLTEKDVCDIDKSDKSVKELSELYGVKIGTIYDILSRRIWKHVPKGIK